MSVRWFPLSREPALTVPAAARVSGVEGHNTGGHIGRRIGHQRAAATLVGDVELSGRV